MKKKTFYFLFTFLFITGFSFLNAQEEVVNESSTSVNYDTSYVNISVDDFKTEKLIYSSGENTKGSFYITNNSDQKTNLKYILFLAGNYGDNTLANSFYGGTEFIFINDLNPSEQRLVNFEYILPDGIGEKDMGIQLQVYTESGNILRWFDTPRIDVVNGLTPFIFSELNIRTSVNGELVQVPSDVGPVMYLDKDPKKLFGSLNYKSYVNEDVTLFPEIYVYDVLDGEKNVYTKKLDLFKTAANTLGEYTFELPRIEKPGVYLAKVIVRDKNNKIRAKEAYYRYIIQGNIIDIKGATVSNFSPKKKDIIQVIFDYTGNPFDPILSSDTENEYTQEEQKNIAKVKIFDDENNLILETQKEFSYPKENVISVDLEMQKKYSKIRAEVEVIDLQGKNIDSFSKEIEFNYEKTPSLLSVILKYIWWIIGFILIINVIIFTSLKIRDKRPLYIILLAVFVSVSYHGIYAQNIQTTSVVVGGQTVSKSGARYSPYTFVNDWYTPQNLQPWPTAGACHYLTGSLIVTGNETYNKAYKQSETMWITGSLNYYQCGNNSMTAKITGTVNGSTKSWSKYTGMGANTSRFGTYSVGPFTTQGTPGNYVYSLTGNLDNGNCHAYFNLTMPYVVAPPQPIVASCSPTPSRVEPNGAVTWTATSTGGTGNYTYSWSGSGVNPIKTSTTTETWVHCAAEGQTCNFTGTKDVAYGAGSSFNFLYNKTSPISCNNATFGDPIRGTAKNCYYKNVITTTSQTSIATSSYSQVGSYSADVIIGSNGTSTSAGCFVTVCDFDSNGNCKPECVPGETDQCLSCPPTQYSCKGQCVPNEQACDYTGCDYDEKMCLDDSCIKENLDCPVCQGTKILCDGLCKEPNQCTPALIESFTAKGTESLSTLINKGESCDLKWAAQGASCDVTRVSDGIKIVNKKVITSGNNNQHTDVSLQETTEYELTCEGGNVVDTKRASCVINPNTTEF